MMKRSALLAALALLSAGCGGGGGGSPPAPPPPAGPPPPSVSLSSTSSAGTTNEDAATTTSFVATVSGSAATPIVPVASFDNAFFSSVTITPAGGSAYTVVAATRADLPGGVQTGAVTVRLCQESACTNVYAGAATHTFAVTVNLRPWTTYQRDGSHTGYVRARLDPSKFAKAWDWSTGEPGYLGGLIAVDGAAYLSTNSRVYRLNETTGTQAWVYVPPPTIESFEGVGAPAYGNGLVCAPMKLASTTPGFVNALGSIHCLDAATGALKSESLFTSQGPYFNSPVIDGDTMYFSKGDLGQFAYRYALPSGAQTWRSTVSTGFNLAQSPGLDSTYMYHSIGAGVAIVNKADGSSAGIIGSSPGSGAGMYSAPVLTRSGRVLVPNIPGVGATRANGLMAGDLATRTVAWRTTEGGYGHQPVSANNTLYVLRDGLPWSVNALSEATGITQWFWPLPASDTYIVENMVVCDNLLFVSSDKTVYALDLTTRQPVWSYPSHGKLTISANLILYITEVGALPSSTKVTAIKLNG